MKCKIDNCDNNLIMARGLCNAHYLRLVRYGRTGSVKREYGTGCFRKDGYKLITVNGVRILEHRYIMETHLGRKLSKDETLHHINKNKLDNRVENLMLTTHSLHRKHHVGEPRLPMSEVARKNIGIAMKREVLNRVRDESGRFASARTSQDSQPKSHSVGQTS